VIVDVTSFLFFKLLGVLLLAVVWLWPLGVAWFCWVGANQGLRSFWEKFWKSVIVVLFVLGAPTYWGFMLVKRDPSVSEVHRYPADGLYHFVLRGFDEQQLRNKADQPPVRFELGFEIRRYRLDGWNPPKHFYVELHDLQTGQHHDRIYVSKHCNSHGSLRRGEEYNIQLQKYSLSNRPGEVFYEFPGLYPVFCQ